MGAAHFDTHNVGGVEGRAARRCEGEGTRANTPTPPFTNIQPPRTKFITTMGAAHFDIHHVGCVEGRAAGRCGGEGTRANTTTSHFTSIQLPLT
jgi:hypothetical protein